MSKTNGFLNTFNKGIDKDSSVYKYGNDVYYDASNVRIISRDALSSGAITNVLGNKGSIDVALSGYNIIASCNINDLLILFYANSDDSISKIGYVEDYTDTSSLKNIIEIYSDESSTSKLNFKNNSFLSVLGRYETNNTSRVYWANGVDPLRSLVMNESYELDEATVFDHIPNQEINLESTLSSSIEIEEKTGGNLKAGVYQYAIQTISKTGSVSLFSHLSRIISIDNYPLSTPVGSNLEDSCNKSILVSIGAIGGSRYRLVSLFYSDYDSTPVINIVSKGASNDQLNIVDSGNYIGSLTLEEFRTINSSIIIPSVIESKNNLLFAGNLKEDEFFDQEIENWDSRAYGFSGYGGNAYIYEHPASLDINDNYAHIFPNGDGFDSFESFFDWDHNIPNAFNRDNELFYNNLDEATYSFHPDYNPSASINGYIRRSDGMFYGLKGKNVSILFRTASYSTEDHLGRIPTDKDLSYNVSGHDSLKFTECQPDEVYRIGVVFFNKKGQSSFVNWIADVRMPYSLQDVDCVDNGDFSVSTTINSGAIEVTLSNAPDYDWKLVRAKRSAEDRSIVSRGIIQPLIEKDSTFEDTLRPYCDFENSIISIDDMNAAALPDETSIVNKRFVEFISPETKFNSPVNVDYTNNKLILSHAFKYVNLGSVESGDDKTIGLYSSEVKNIRSESSLTSVTYDYKIKDSIYVSTESYVPDVEPRSYTIDSKSYVNQTFLDLDSSFTPAGMRSSRASGIILALDNDLTITDSEENRLLMGYSLSDNDISRYGGYSIDSRTMTEYISFSDVKSSSDSVAIGTRGDVFHTQMSALRLLYNTYNPENYNAAQQQFLKFFMSSQIDCNRRSDKIDSNLTIASDPISDFIFSPWIQETVAEGIKLYPESYDESIGNLYIYNPAYSRQGDAAIFYPKPENFIVESENTVKVNSSQIKLNGEEEDSWLKFLVSDYIEVDGDYGKLNQIIAFKQDLFFFQENAIGVLSVNSRSLISDSDGRTLALGTGGVLERYDYLSYNSGAASGFDTIKTKNSVYFIDENSKEFYTISSPDHSISNIKGVDNYFYENVIKGDVRSIGYDTQYNEVLINLNGKTICYNELLKSFTSEYSINPIRFITTPAMLMSQYYDSEISLNNYIYAHNYGDRGGWYPDVMKPQKSTITLIVNPNGNSINQFDNISLRTDVYSDGENAPDDQDLIEETVSRIKYTNSYIDEITIESNFISENISSSIKRLVRSWRSQVPLTEKGNRFADSYLMITFEFDNVDNKLFKLHDVITYFRQTNY